MIVRISRHAGTQTRRALCVIANPFREPLRGLSGTSQILLTFDSWLRHHGKSPQTYFSVTITVFLHCTVSYLSVTFGSSLVHLLFFQRRNLISWSSEKKLRPLLFWRLIALRHPPTDGELWKVHDSDEATAWPHSNAVVEAYLYLNKCTIVYNINDSIQYHYHLIYFQITSTYQSWDNG